MIIYVNLILYLRRCDVPTYTYQCNCCNNVDEVFLKASENYSKGCSQCGKKVSKVILYAPGVVIPPQHQAAGSKLQYYGVKNIQTGEGITKDTDVSSPPGISAKPVKG